MIKEEVICAAENIPTTVDLWRKLDTAGTEPTGPGPFSKKGLHQQLQSCNHHGVMSLEEHRQGCGTPGYLSKDEDKKEPPIKWKWMKGQDQDTCLLQID